MAETGTALAMPARLRRAATGGRSLLAQPAVRRALPWMLAALVFALVAWGATALLGGGGRPVYPGLPEAERAGVVEALTAAGFDPSVDSTSGEVLVSDSDYHRARMALAAAGLPKAAPAGYAVLDGLPLGISRPVEAARLRQAEESDLARSIGAMDGVLAARVHIAASEPSAFVRDAAAPSASVFVTFAPGRALGEGQALAIVRLVSASVAGLAPDRVSVVDQSGRLLTPDAGGLGESRAQLDYALRLEASYRERIAALLTPLAGAGNVSTEVALDLDFAPVQVTRERVDPGNSAVRSEQGTGARDTPPLARGIPGALSNVVPGAAQVTTTLPVTPPPVVAAPQSGGSYTRTFEVGRSTEVSAPQPGAIKRLTAAVVIRAGAGVKPKQIAELTRLVRDAVGFDAARGDRVSLTLLPFVETPEAAPPWSDSPALGLAERVGVPLLIAAMLAFAVVRPLARRIATVPPAALPAPANAEPHRLEAVRLFVRDDRATASRALRQLVRDETPA